MMPFDVVESRMMSKKYILPDMRQLRTFVEVINAGGFSKASNVLHMTQPCVTGHIRKLEEAVGTVLIERNGRRLMPTDAGKRLHEFASKMLHDVTDVIRSIRQECDDAEKWIRVGSPPNFADFLIHQQSGFKKYNPDIHFSISYQQDKSVLRDLSAGMIDVGFVTNPPTSLEFVYEELFVDEVVVVASDRYRGVELIDSEDDLQKVRFIDYPECSNLLKIWVRHHFGESSADVPKVVYSHYVSATNAVVELVLQGHGYAVLPLSVVAARINSRELSIVPGPEVSAPTLPIYWVVRRNVSQNDLLRSLRGYLSQYRNGY